LAPLTSSLVAFVDATNKQLRTYDFNGSTWSQTGSSFSITGANFSALATLSSSSVAFFDNSNAQLRAYGETSDYLQYRIYLYQSDCSTAVGSSPFAQSSSQTGWSGQDANAGTAYAGGTTATYAYQGTLSAGTTYCWKADAIDPGGSNSYGSVSATQTFTTVAGGGSDSVTVQGGVTIQGGSTIQ